LQRAAHPRALFDAMEQHFMPTLRPKWMNGFAIFGHAFII
jgi:hypothetical protein